jgi:hypothetical protein
MVERKIVGSKSRLVFALILDGPLMRETAQVLILPTDNGSSLFNSAQDRRKNSIGGVMPSRSQRRLRQCSHIPGRPTAESASSFALKKKRCDPKPSERGARRTASGETADYSGEVYPAGLPLALYMVKRSAGHTAQSVQYCTL